jgi:cell division protein FtsW (lipid II flippase)
MFPGRSFSLPLMLIPLTVLLLVLLGLSGIQRGDELELTGEFAPRQVIWLALGCFAAGVGTLIPAHRLKGLSYPLYIVGILLLVGVYFFPPRNGSRRWIPLGVISMQPSELAKLAYILALSEYLMFRRNHRTVFGLVPPFVMTIVPVLLILKEPDLGTSLLFFPVLFALLYTAGARRGHLLAALIAGVAAAPVLWSVMSAEQKSRVTAVFSQTDGGTPDMGDGYHLHQSKQLLALGGTWGSVFAGMPVSDPVAYRLPAGRTDFVFCLIGERWGLPGTLGVISLFGLLIACGLQVAASTRDPFCRLLATGIVTILATQVLINTAMTVGLAPITGLTLPLVSYGGSSLITTAFSLGLLMSMARAPGFDVAGQPFQFAE